MAPTIVAVKIVVADVHSVHQVYLWGNHEICLKIHDGLEITVVHLKVVQIVDEVAEMAT